MGSVFLAEHLHMGRRDAVKVLSRSVADDQDARARFTREARNASTINHPNVCTVYDFGEIRDGLPFIAMEYVEGHTLTEVMEREGPLPPERVVRIGAQVCRALEAAHRRKIVHRDLKPDNIMLTREPGGGEAVKVVDFGIAKAMREEGEEDGGLTRAGWVVGTPEYVSPEQLEGRELDGRSDLYSLGVVLFRALSGRLPFSGESWQEVMTSRLSEDPADLTAVAGDRVPAGLAGAIRRVLERDRDRRHPDAGAFRADLERSVEPSADGSGAGLAATVAVPRGDAPPRGGRPDPADGEEAGSPGPDPGGAPAEPASADRRRTLAWIAGGAVGVAGLALAGVVLLGGGGDGSGAAGTEAGSDVVASEPTEDTSDGTTGAGTEATGAAEIVVSFPPGSLPVGGTGRADAEVTDADGRPLQRSPSWTSLDPGVATVEADGSVTGRAAGTAGLVASVGGVADTLTLRVRERGSEQQEVGEGEQQGAEPAPDPRTVLDRQFDRIALGPQPSPAELSAIEDTARTYWGREDLSPELRAHAAWVLSNALDSRGQAEEACRWIRQALDLVPGVDHYRSFRAGVCEEDG